MTETEQWPLIQGKARIWPNGQQQCHNCLGLFSTRDRRRCYCSKQCQNAMHRESRCKSKHKAVKCLVCHRQFIPRQHNQKWCSEQCRKLAYYRRKHRQPTDRLSHIHDDTDKEQRRANRLAEKRRMLKETQEEQGPLRPIKKHIKVLDPNELLPGEIRRRITKILANQTDKEKSG